MALTNIPTFTNPLAPPPDRTAVPPPTPIEFFTSAEVWNDFLFQTTYDELRAFVLATNTFGGEIEAIGVASALSEANALASEQASALSEANALASEQASALSATDAQLSSWIAEAEELTAKSYATEPEDVFVKTYASNGDGTLTATPTTQYSALHHQIKATASALSIDPLNLIHADDTTETKKGKLNILNDTTIGESISITSWSYTGTTFTINVANHNAKIGYTNYISGLIFPTETPPNGTHIVDSIVAGVSITYAFVNAFSEVAGVSSALVKYGELKNFDGLSALFDGGKSLSASGYQKLSNGLILQWGTTGAVANNVFVDVNFPIVFPIACLVSSLIPYTNGIDDVGDYLMSVVAINSTRVRVVSSNNSPNAFYIAIGY